MTPTPGWLQENLFERRIVFVTGRLDEALAGQAAAQIITLAACGDAPIDVVLGSADGTLEAAFVLIDALDATHATVRVQCQGQVGGPVIGVVASAVALHEPLGAGQIAALVFTLLGVVLATRS